MIDVFFRCIFSADGTLFDFRKFVSNQVAEFVFLSGSSHEPVSVDAQDVEPMEAAVDTD